MRINPSKREEISELHKCEPYVYPQMIAGKDAPTHGEAKNSWLSGTAAMNYVAITQAILGIQPQYNGLEVRPIIPSDWREFEAVRYFRDVRYEISVDRKGPGNKISLVVDGNPIPGTIIPLPERDVRTLKVIAYIGQK
jgi:cellobiose phosphorylase